MTVPFGFTADYHSPAALDAAWDQFIDTYGHFDSVRRSHMWHRYESAASVELDSHRCAVFTADLSAPRGHLGPNALLHLAVCEPCQWHSIGDQSEVVVAWHDHAIPDWRVLPVIPEGVPRHEMNGWPKKGLEWVEEHYPPDMQRDGAPVITERRRIAGRHVPGYSPWGGYDLSHWALDIAPTTEVTDRGLAISHPTLF